jgi:chromosome segregation ATPase
LEKLGFVVKDHVQDEHDYAIRQLKNEIEDLKATCDTEEVKCASMKCQALSFKRQAKLLTEQVAALTDEQRTNLELKQELEAEVEEFKSKFDSQQKASMFFARESQSLKKDIDTNNEELTALLSANSLIRGENKKLIIDKETLWNNKGQLDIELKEFKAKYEKAVNGMARLEAEKDEVLAKNEMVLNENTAKFQAEKEKLEALIEKMKQELAVVHNKENDRKNNNNQLILMATNKPGETVGNKRARTEADNVIYRSGQDKETDTAALVPLPLPPLQMIKCK